jgi:hypothetical protein
VIVDEPKRLAGIEHSAVDRDRATSMPVAIVGMHRSGTSMVAKLLQQSGLNLGSAEDLMPPAEQNPEGFYEHLEFVRLNDEVLNAAGAGWDCPPPVGTDWASDRFQTLRERASILAEPLQADSPWGWKDPRTTITIPFWRAALGPLRTIAVVRNPLEVVTSLHRRNGFSIALSLTLWQIYAERLLHDTAPEERLVTHYDAYFLEPGREISRLLSFVGLDADLDAGSLQAAAVPGLRHHRKTILDLTAHGFPSEIIDLYRQLSREAEWWEGAGESSATEQQFIFTGLHSAHTIARGAGAVDLMRIENVALRQNNADYVARISDLEKALQAHESGRVELEEKVSEREGRIHERNSLIARRDHAITTLQQQLAHVSAELSVLREEAAEFSVRLADSEQALAMAEVHERELRSMYTRLQETQLERDAEIMGTLGAVLSRHAPGAPASIYHRRLVEQVRRIADGHLPVDARVLVATYGDPALLQLGPRQTESFPEAATAISADYTDVNDEVAIAQVEAKRAAGVEYLIVPGPAQPWLVNHPSLERHLDHHYAVVARERGVVIIYALSRQEGQIPA